MIPRFILPLIILPAAVLLAGCAAKNVRCDSRLTPINAPASPVPDVAPAPEASP
jgi:hypothetical protein